MLATAMSAEFWRLLTLSLDIFTSQMIYSCDGQKIVERQEQKVHKIFKYRRNQLHNQKTSQTLQREAKEGKTYERSIGLNLDMNATQPSPTAFDT